MKNNKKKKKLKAILIASVILLIFFSSLHPIFAAPYANQEKIPGASQQQTEFIPYLKDVINFGFVILGILALFMLIIGAYQYLMAAGNIGSIDNAKQTIGSALLGLILGLCAWIILNKINPDLVNMRAITQISGGGIAGQTPVMGAIGIYNTIKPKGKEAEATMAYIDIIKKYAEEKGVPLHIAFGLVAQESGGNPLAKSDRGAMGLMQLIPRTADDLGVTDPYNPEQNIKGGITYLKQMYDQFGSWEDAIAAYNVGPNAFKNVKTWENLPAETKAHVPAVMGYANWYIQQTSKNQATIRIM